jgi:hypothetical protein
MKFHSLALLAIAGVMSHTSLSDAALIYGVDDSSGQTLVSFNSAAPNTYLSGVAITGLQNNETIKGIDFRPSTHQLFALGSSNRLYTIQANTGVATPVGAGPFAPVLSGSNFGFDFNPAIDRIRVVSNTKKNYVLNPNDGTATGATDLFFAAGDTNDGVNPNVSFSAYTNSVIPAPMSTQLYGIDTALDVLVTQANSAGTLATVGPLGIDFGAVGGFDISGSGANGVAYAALLPANTSVSRLYQINLATGAATDLGLIDGGAIISSMAVAPAGFDPDVIIPEPTTVALAVLALAGFATRRVRG